jgi:hypothetical protein
MIDILEQRYKLSTWATTTASTDSLFSGGTQDPYLDCLQLAFDMGGNTEILVTLTKEGLAMIYILKFKTVMDRVKFNKDFSLQN